MNKMLLREQDLLKNKMVLSEQDLLNLNHAVALNQVITKLYTGKEPESSMQSQRIVALSIAIEDYLSLMEEKYEEAKLWRGDQEESVLWEAGE